MTVSKLNIELLIIMCSFSYIKILVLFLIKSYLYVTRCLQNLSKIGCRNFFLYTFKFQIMKKKQKPFYAIFVFKKVIYNVQNIAL